MENPTADLIRRYYGAFNDKDPDGMLACLTDLVEHHVNQGPVRHGRESFAEFLETARRHYDERVEQLVVMTDPTGERAAAEFIVVGAYRVKAEGLPPARGQRYTLPAGAFFSVLDGRITRVSTYYNLEAWKAQVEGRAVEA